MARAYVASGFSRTLFQYVASGFSRTLSGFSRTLFQSVASGFSRTLSGFSRTLVLAAVVLSFSAGAAAQRGGGQGGAPAPTPRAAAPVDLTGLWVSIVTEDWRWRMRTPPKGDYASVPMTPAARKIADAWDPARDAAAGEQCRAYGAAAVMRVPGRVRISWQDDFTLKVETEAGTQTRLFRFQPSTTPEPPSWQGTSVATWQFAGGGRRGAPVTGGSLQVVTTNLRPGYLRRNGVPYSANARVTEYFNRVESNGVSWLIVTTMVEDPEYLTDRFVTSSHFKKVPDGSAWSPRPCE